MPTVTAFMRPAPITSIRSLFFDWERRFVKSRHKEIKAWDEKFQLKRQKDDEEAGKLRQELGLPDETKTIVEQHFNLREAKIAFEAVRKQNLQPEESKTRSVSVIREDTLLITEQDRPATLYQFLVCDDGNIDYVIGHRAFD